jgi:DNA-binding MarR family transcriptional regulator
MAQDEAGDVHVPGDLVNAPCELLVVHARPPRRARFRLAAGQVSGHHQIPVIHHVRNCRAAPECDELLESSSHWYPGPVTEEADHAGQVPVKWLTAEELESWLSLVRLMMWLPWSIDQQLQRDSKLGMVEYQVLAMLSRSPERTLRMSSLAVLTNASLSRLSHLVKRLEERGLVRREPDPADGRFTHAILTEEGCRILAEAAPGHVAHVRSLIIDVLSPEQLRRVGRAADRIMSHIDTSGIN